MKNILFIGGLGYIGSSLVNKFSDCKEYNCTIIDTYWFGNYVSNRSNVISSRSTVTYIQKDYDELSKEELSLFDVIILTAAHSSVKMCTNAPFYSMKNNVFKHINLVSKLTNQKFIYMSSSSVYGNTNNLIVDENYPISTPNNEYDLSKWIIDEYMKKTNIDYYGLRLGTVNGPSPNLRTDIMINSMVNDAVINNEIRLYITDIWRPILGINDLGRIIECVINNDKQNSVGIYNVASFNSTVKDIGEKVSECLNVPCNIYDKQIIENKTNIKLQSNAYNFSMSCKKFEDQFDFKFLDTIESLVSELKLNYYQCNKSTRNVTINDDYIRENIYDIESQDCKLKKNCRVCDTTISHCVIDLGDQPLANNFHDNKIMSGNKSTMSNIKSYPLKLMLCENCYHLQLSHVVNPSILFKNYQYLSGTSSTLDKYFEWLSLKINNSDDFKEHTILEIACNDGSQLNHFKKLGWKTYGVDPAENIYKISSLNHDIYCDYFGTKFASTLNGKTFDVILAENVFAHVDDVNDFLKGCKLLMNNKSRLFIQTSQCDMIKNNEFDTIYHEHLSFFTIKSMNTVVNNNGMYIQNFEKTPIHGTSYLFTMTLNESKNGLDFIETEKELYNLDNYITYKNNISTVVDNLKCSISKYKNDGYSIIGYGAAAKGNTLLNYTNIKLDYIIDDCVSKHELYTPGSNIIIKDKSCLLETINKNSKNSKIIIIPLAWNFFDEIYLKVNSLLENMTYDTTVSTPNIVKFIKYFPSLQIVDSLNQKLTVISHFYNEEYLLPFWLTHNKKIFNHGIMINYGSTDNSVDIIKSICPNWTIINSRNKFFDAKECDIEVIEIEQSISGWKIALNTTEFLIGDIRSIIKSCDNKTIFKIKPIIMVDHPSLEFTELDVNIPITQQRTWGIKDHNMRGHRFIHNYPSIPYNLGRHELLGNKESIYLDVNTISVAWYGYSPFNDEIIDRKLQIQTKIPQHDKDVRLGGEHLVDKNKLIETFRLYQKSIIDFKDDKNMIYFKK